MRNSTRFAPAFLAALIICLESRCRITAGRPLITNLSPLRGLWPPNAIANRYPTYYRMIPKESIFLWKRSILLWIKNRKNPIDSTMDTIRKLIREKAAERELSLSWLSRRMGRNHGYLYDFLEKGTPQKLPEVERRKLAQHLGISEDYLRPADLMADVKEVAPTNLEEGERIDVEDIRDQRLRESVRRELKAAKHGEAWLIRTPLIEAKYPPGT